MTSIFLRSLAFNVVFYAWLVFLILLAIPTFFMPYPATMAFARFWARTSIWLMRVICNIRVEYRGREKIPAGPLLIAAKHQSMWETFALVQFFEHPIYILKRDLLLIPFFGWYLRKVGMIGIDRTAGARALLAMTRQAREVVRGGAQLVIFPEGTRTAPGASPEYKTGVAQLYFACGVPCLPVALNSGLFWPRRTFLRYPGTLVVEFLDPLPAGLSRDDFMREVEGRIETATGHIVEAGRREQALLFGGAQTPNRFC